ncbi:MAG: HepT-like ribonuclease domain-containing protein [Candidatus Heimdallarchaeaceae archaeon]
MPREYRLYLSDILDSIDKIGEYIGELSFEEFSANSLIQDAVVRNLGIIAEASKNIPKEIRELKKNIDWRKIIRFRDIITTDFVTNLDVVWEVISERILELEEAVKEILNHRDNY